MKMKRFLALLLALLLICSIGTVAFATEDESIVGRAPACVCGGAYSAIEEYWDYDNPLRTRLCVYEYTAQARDYYLTKYRSVRCNRCGEEYSRVTIDLMWFCPHKNVFYYD